MKMRKFLKLDKNLEGKVEEIQGGKKPKGREESRGFLQISDDSTSR